MENRFDGAWIGKFIHWKLLAAWLGARSKLRVSGVGFCLLFILSGDFRFEIITEG